MIHSEIMLLELIKLYYKTSDGEDLDLDNLEKAFYTLEELIGNQLNVILEYDFNQEFDKFEEMSENNFTIQDNRICFSDEEYLDLLEDLVLLALEDEDLTYDGFISNSLHNICIYRDLNIKPCYDKYTNLFSNCFTIMQNYLFLAYQEAKTGIINPILVSLVQSLVKQHEDYYAMLQDEDLIKIEVILSYFNEMYLVDDDCDFCNSDWYTILFSKHKKQLSSLNYQRIITSMEEDDISFSNYNKKDIPENDMEEDEQNSTLDNLIPDKTYLFNEIDFFIRYYIVYLNQYLHKLEENGWKKDLLQQKYLLIATNPSIEEYFLKAKTLDGLDFPKLEKKWFTDGTFTSLYLTVIDCIEEFNFKDAFITDRDCSHMVTCALFIRSFLDLSINEEQKEEVKKRILNSNFYKKEDYLMASSFIDDIIFREQDMHLTRELK